MVMPKATDPSIHVKVEPAFFARIKRLAVAERRTLANLCRILLEEAINRREK